MVMKEGRIHAIGPPEEVITKEALDFVYGCHVFVDENPLIGRPRVTLVGE
jgi:ABC-type hemin transport system ATPase subunit